MSRGILYIASGDQWIEEAKQSAASVRAVMPSVAITLITEQPTESAVFDQILQRPLESGYMGRITHILSSPYDRTLFLDTDTYACADFSEVFDLLDVFDFAAVHAPRRYSIEHHTSETRLFDNIPIAFPELNGGLLLFRKNSAVEMCLRTWKSEFQKDLMANISCDQPSLRRAIYHSRTRLTVLPPEYNCRFVVPVGITRDVKILHGRHPNLAQIAKTINRSPGIRMFSLETGLFVHPRKGLQVQRTHPLKLLFWRLTGRQIV